MSDVSGEKSVVDPNSFRERVRQVQEAKKDKVRKMLEAEHISLQERHERSQKFVEELKEKRDRSPMSPMSRLKSSLKTKSMASSSSSSKLVTPKDRHHLRKLVQVKKERYDALKKRQVAMDRRRIREAAEVKAAEDPIYNEMLKDPQYEVVRDNFGIVEAHVYRPADLSPFQVKDQERQKLMARKAEVMKRENAQAYAAAMVDEEAPIPAKIVTYHNFNSKKATKKQDITEEDIKEETSMDEPRSRSSNRSPRRSASVSPNLNYLRDSFQQIRMSRPSAKMNLPQLNRSQSNGDISVKSDPELAAKKLELRNKWRELVAKRREDEEAIKVEQKLMAQCFGDFRVKSTTDEDSPRSRFNTAIENVPKVPDRNNRTGFPIPADRVQSSLININGTLYNKPSQAKNKRPRTAKEKIETEYFRAKRPRNE